MSCTAAPFLFSPVERAFPDGLEGKETDFLSPSIDYEQRSKALGFADSFKTVAEYKALWYTDRARFDLLQQYIGDVENGWITPLYGFAKYEETYHYIQSNIVKYSIKFYGERGAVAINPDTGQLIQTNPQERR